MSNYKHQPFWIILSDLLQFKNVIHSSQCYVDLNHVIRSLARSPNIDWWGGEECFLVILASTYGLGPYGSWTIHYLKEFLSQICSRTIFEMHGAPEACLLYAPQQYAFQIWSWSIMNVEYSSRLLKVQDHKVLMVLYHKSRPKSHKSGKNIVKAKHSAFFWTMSCPIFYFSGDHG